MYFELLTGDGQLLKENPLNKVTGMVKAVTKEIKDASTSVIENVKDACEMVGECVKKNGVMVVNKTVTATKESIQKIQSIADIISKAKCVIPKDANNILRAALLQQCLSPSLGKRVKHILYHNKTIIE